MTLLRRFSPASLLAALLLLLSSLPLAAHYSQRELAQLTKEERVRLERYLAAQDAHERVSDAYWRRVDDKRAARARKTRRAQAVTADDYVLEHPPTYDGPPEPEDVIKRLGRRPTRPPKPLPVVADFLDHARKRYGFTPQRVSEDAFMRRYAEEALRLGLSRDQVVRVYALETGGIGTHDLQSGLHPVTGKGRAMSTALGYAQLLSANSAGELVKHGPAFSTRLEAMAELAPTPARAKALRAKAAVLRSMRRHARGAAGSWSRLVRFGATSRGLAIHCLNLDGDVGPWLQVQKLAGIKTIAERAGLGNPTGGQLELMNLAGPSRGLEMLKPAARDVPTANFFARLGYERNPVVHNRTAGELLTKLDEIMDRNVHKPGAARFAAIFDEVGRLLAEAR